MYVCIKQWGFYNLPNYYYQGFPLSSFECQQINRPCLTVCFQRNIAHCLVARQPDKSPFLGTIQFHLYDTMSCSISICVQIPSESFFFPDYMHLATYRRKLRSAQVDISPILCSRGQILNSHLLTSLGLGLISPRSGNLKHRALQQDEQHPKEAL